MNKLTFFFAGLLLIPFIFDEAFAQVEKGKNFDRVLISENFDGTNTYQWISHAERIFDDTINQWRDYVLFEDINIIKVESAQGSYIFDKNDCTLSFYKGGVIDKNDSPIIGSDTYAVYQSVDGTGVWNAVSQINDAQCQTTLIQNSTHLEIQGMKAHAVGEFKVRYIKTDGSPLKTQLEVTNLSGLTDRRFGFTQTIDVPQFIKFGNVQRDLSQFDDKTFDRDFLLNNKANVTKLTDKVNFDFSQAFKYLSDIRVMWDGSQSSLVFNFSNNAPILLPNEMLVIDPTFSEADPTVDGTLRDDSNNEICDAAPASLIRDDTTAGLSIGILSAASAADCDISFYEWDTTSIPDTSIIVDSDFLFDITAIFGGGPGTCDFRQLTNKPSGAVGAAALWADVHDGNTYVNNDAQCDSAGNNKSVDLGPFGDLDIQNNLGVNWFAIGVHMDGDIGGGTSGGHKLSQPAAEEDGAATPPPTLSITYVLLENTPDAVDDLVAANTTFSGTDLAWTAPELRGGIFSGYQINFTTPIGNPQLIIINDTLSSITNFEVSGLSQFTNYSFRVSVWTNNTNNATGNIVNLTTISIGNFTVGAIDIDTTNIDFRTWKFARTDLNSSAYSLSVIYPNTYNATCSFHFKFAMIDQNFSNLVTSGIGDELEATFVFNNTSSEVIDVLCIDENDSTTPEGIFLLTQSNFLLLQQFAEFRDGTYGTLGMIGSIDLITMVGIIVAMIGFNRINESVGYFFLIAILGVMAFFQIIIWPVALSGLILVVGVLTYTSTRKPG